MKNLSILLLICFASFSSMQAQRFEFNKSIGEFSEATSFSLNPAGYFFVADAGNNEIVKLDKDGNALVTRGGYGWTSATFDYPSDIYSETLRIIAADKNNHRIQFFDKDLTFLSEFNTKEKDDELYSFQYPAAAAISNQGDLFILDSDNSRILKYDLSGNFLLELGSYDAGDYTLSSPKTFVVSPDGKLFVLDETGLILFDQYGNGLSKLDSGFDAENINITFTNLVINDSEKIKFVDLTKAPLILHQFTPDKELLSSNIIEGILTDKNLYLLTETEILIFNRFDK